jgi:hypothetical protein
MINMNVEKFKKKFKKKIVLVLIKDLQILTIVA